MSAVVCRVTTRFIPTTALLILDTALRVPFTVTLILATVALILLTAIYNIATPTPILATAIVILMTAMINNCHGDGHSGDGDDQ